MAPAKKNIETAGQPASISATVSAPKAAPVPHKSETELHQEAVRARLEYLQLQRMEEEEAAKEEQRQMQIRAREQGARTMARQREAELAKQASCNHTKPNGRPAIGGQRDHQGDYRFICLFCSKEWTNNELPQNLIIDRDMIGGPAH
jgi:hypothetical protein